MIKLRTTDQIVSKQILSKNIKDLSKRWVAVNSLIKELESIRMNIVGKRKLQDIINKLKLSK